MSIYLTTNTLTLADKKNTKKNIKLPEFIDANNLMHLESYLRLHPYNQYLTLTKPTPPSFKFTLLSERQQPLQTTKTLIATIRTEL